MAKKLQNIEQPFDKKFVSTDSQNRSKDISLSDTNFDKFSLSLETIDELIVYYIKNSIKPTVRQNNQNIEVDVIFGNEELFNTVQAEGYYRDKNEKLLYPLIILNRTSVEKNNDFFTKIDANYPEDFYFYEKKFSKKNIYGRTNEINTSREFVKIPIANYVNITFEGVILTNYKIHQNKLIESILYASNSYWGNLSENSYRFLTVVETFSDNSDVSVDNERIIKSNFTLKVKAYLIGDGFQENINKNVEHNYTHLSVKENFKI
jgi:hypothetical protein